MTTRNADLANKIAQAATSFADRVRCEQGKEPDVRDVRAAFEELFETWQDVDAGLVIDEDAD